MQVYSAVFDSVGLTPKALLQSMTLGRFGVNSIKPDKTMISFSVSIRHLPKVKVNGPRNSEK